MPAYRNFAFVYPFTRNHCVPCAWTHLGGGDDRTVVALAQAARAVDRLTAKGGVYNTTSSDQLAWWSREVGVEVVKVEHYIRTTPEYTQTALEHLGPDYKSVRKMVSLKTWARRHPVGKWLVLVPGHAVAVINGMVWGYYKTSSIVQHAVQVKRLGEVIAPVVKQVVRARSAVQGAVKMVWEIADDMFGKPRSEVVAACVRAGINENTAKTQYQRWYKLNGRY